MEKQPSKFRLAPNRLETWKSDSKPYIPRDKLMSGKSRGNVVGLVFDSPLDPRDGVTLKEAIKILADHAAKHDAEGNQPYHSVLRDFFQLGAVSIKFATMVLGIDKSRLIIDESLTGETVNRGKPTRRNRHFVEANIEEDRLLTIDVRKGLISKDTLKIFQAYVENNTHQMSRIARGLRKRKISEEELAAKAPTESDSTFL
jgi:hypothetical protein